MNTRRESSTPPNVDGPPYSSSRSRSFFSNRSSSGPFGPVGSSTPVLAFQFSSTQPSSASGQQIYDSSSSNSSGRLAEYTRTNIQHQDYPAGCIPTASTTFIGPVTTTTTPSSVLAIPSTPTIGSNEFAVNSSSFPPNNHPYFGEDSYYSGLGTHSGGVPLYYSSPATQPQQQVLMQSNNYHHPSPVYNMKTNSNNKNKGDNNNNTINNSARPSTTSGFHPHSTSSSTVQPPPQPQQQQQQLPRTEDWIDLEDVMDGPSAANYHLNAASFITSNNNNNNNPPPLLMGGGSYPFGISSRLTPPPGPSSHSRNQQQQHVRTPPHHSHQDQVEQQHQQQSMGMDANMIMRMQQQQSRGRSITPPPPHYHSSPGVNYYYVDQRQPQQYPMDDQYYQQFAGHPAGYPVQQQPMIMFPPFPPQQQPQQPQQSQQDGYQDGGQQEHQQRHQPHHRHRRRSGDGVTSASTTSSVKGRLPFSSSSTSNISRRNNNENNEMMMMARSPGEEEEDEHHEHEEEEDDGPIEDLRYGLQKEHLSDLHYANLHHQTRQEQQDEEDQQQRQREIEEDELLMMMKRQRPASSIGENRLKIKFESFGTLGEIKQTYGRRDSIIPDGLCGSNEVYNERWRFEIKHHCRGQRVMIEWLITNLATNKLYKRKETVEESIIRETQGKTICNQVLKQALDDRADELEKELRLAEEEKNNTRVSNLTSRVRSLRPKRCLIGLLFFGLQHQCVQDHMKVLEEQQQHQEKRPVARGDGVEEDGHSQQQHQVQDWIDSNKSKDQDGDSHQLHGVEGHQKVGHQ